MLLVLMDDHPAALDAVGFASGIGEPVHAAVFGDPPADDLGKHGVSVVHRISHELLDNGYSPEACGEALAQLVDALQPSAVLAPGNDHGVETMAHVAARRALPLATNCVSVTPRPELGALDGPSSAPAVLDGTSSPRATPGDVWQLTRLRGGGMLLEDAELTADIALLTLAPGVSGQAAAGTEPAVIERFEPQLEPELARTRVVEHTTRGEGVTLATAPVVVSGGRGVGSKDGYAALEELAELLGGAVGCSRVATNNGWRPHSDQVGLTGTKIAPRLYIACGISGATQHWVGCMDAKAILAVNTDPNAPMVTRATYAVIGDVHEVIPAVVAELRTRTSP